MTETLTVERLKEMAKQFAPLERDRAWREFARAVENGAMVVVAGNAEAFAREQFPEADIRVSEWVEPGMIYALTARQDCVVCGQPHTPERTPAACGFAACPVAARFHAAKGSTPANTQRPNLEGNK